MDYVKQLEEQVEVLQKRLAMFEDKIELYVIYKESKNGLSNYEREIRYVEINAHVKRGNHKEFIAICSAHKPKHSDVWNISEGSFNHFDINKNALHKGDPDEIRDFMLYAFGYKDFPYILDDCRTRKETHLKEDIEVEPPF